MARDDLHTPAMSNPANPPKKRGCLFYGCLSVLVLGICIVVFGLIGLNLAKKKFLALRAEWTDLTPQAIETVTYPPPQREELQARVAKFKQALDAGKLGEELVLTATDLNVLIGENPDTKGRLFVTVDGDRFKAKVSIPLQDIGPLKLSGRYLNGEAVLRVALENKMLDVRVDSVEVRGKPLPDFIMKEFKKNNLAKDFNADPDHQKELDKFDSLHIKDGKIIIKSGKPGAPNPGPLE